MFLENNDLELKSIDMGSLNSVQLKAATHYTGPAVVYAGAGSGKTRVICYRIAWLLTEKHVPNYSILAVTFTNKAAKEMKERVEQLVGPRKSRNLIISTFHSFCARFLRMYASELGFSNSFSIYDDDDQKSLLKDILKNLNVSEKILSVATVKSKIDKIKNKGLTPDEYLKVLRNDPSASENEYKFSLKKFGENYDPYLIQKIYEIYQNKLKNLNAMDFNDLILNFVSLLKLENSVALKYLQNRFNFFLIDEFQDTNPIQFQLISCLASLNQNLFIVGDDDQSIYSWRGADPTFILNFNQLFPNASLYKLEENYRSTGHIIRSAAHLISHNKHRTPKTLFTNKELGKKIKVIPSSDPQIEAHFVANEIFTQATSDRIFSHYCVLYRTNAQSRLVEDELRRRMVPYVIYGSVRFYERAEIKILVSYLKTLINTQDDQAFLKIVNTPRRGFGDSAVEKLKVIAQEKNESLIHIATELVYGAFPESYFRSMSGLKELIQNFQEWKRLLSDEEKPSFIVQTLISDIRFEEYIRNNYPEDFDDRLLNVLEFKNAVIEFENNYKNLLENDTETDAQGELSSKDILSKFIEQAMLIVEPTVKNLKEGEGNAITLMTIHSAKGLEFNQVFIVGLEEGIFPHQNALNDSDDVEEERRLMYVAMTRARETLFLSYSKKNRYKDFLPAQESRFLSEIPNEFLEWENRGGQNHKSSSHSSPSSYGKTASFSKNYGLVFRADELLSNKNSVEQINRKAVAPVQNILSSSEWKMGQRVKHKVFGEGTVKDVEKSVLGYKLKVKFDSNGEKTLIHTYVTAL